jgi:hypothetical protein
VKEQKPEASKRPRSEPPSTHFKGLGHGRELLPVTITRSGHREAKETAADCIHCYGSGQILEQVEGDRDRFEDEAHECWMCLGTGRRMSKAEREHIKRGQL